MVHDYNDVRVFKVGNIMEGAFKGVDMTEVPANTLNQALEFSKI